MSTATLNQPKITVSIPGSKRTYVGFYHFRAAAPLSMVFEYAGELKEAIERFKIHCERCNYRFIKVRPFIVDLDEREARINGQEGYYQENGL